jgi:hypothetical protein
VTPTKILQPQTNGNSKWTGAPIVADSLSLVIKQNMPLKEFKKMDLKLNKDGHAIFNQKYVLQTTDKVLLIAPGVETGRIK